MLKPTGGARMVIRIEHKRKRRKERKGTKGIREKREEKREKKIQMRAGQDPGRKVRKAEKKATQ